MRFRTWLVAWSLWLASPWLVLAQTPFGRVAGTLVPPDQLEALMEELSGTRAKQFVQDISRYDRIQASEGWVQAAEYVMSRLSEAGLEGQLEGYPSDGARRYFTWTPPMGWRIRRGELWLLEPERQKLADWKELPSSIAKGSQSADVVAEVVAVRRGTQPSDYEGLDVRGKVVLADGYAGDVHREAVLRRGAAGVITYLSRQDRMEFPDFIPYQGLWIRKEEQPKTTFGFTISRRTAEQLLSWLDQGRRVVVRAIVDGEDYPSQVRTLACVIPGKSGKQEILFIAHLDHYQPGAIDNASGSAALLELACSLKRLIDEGRLPPPERSIRFIWTSEWYGTVPWIQLHFRELPKIVAGFNLDMVGGDLEKTRSFFVVVQTPWSRPSFVNDLCSAVVEDVARMDVWSPNGSRTPFSFRIGPYSGGSDHWMFNDAAVGVPMPMFIQPDFHHHTVQDVPDNVDPTQMERVLLISALCARTLAWADERVAVQLSHLTAAGAHGRLAEAASELAMQLVNAPDPQWKANALEAGRNRLSELGRKEMAAVLSVRSLEGGPVVQGVTQSLAREIQSQTLALLRRFDSPNLRAFLGVEPKGLPTPQLPSGLERTGKWVPRRTPDFVGPLAPGYLQEVLGPEAAAGSGLGEAVEFEIANFMDGKRTLREIWNAVRAEFGDVDYDKMVGFVQLVERARLVEIAR
jgi:hypothetical protein